MLKKYLLPFAGVLTVLVLVGAGCSSSGTTTVSTQTPPANSGNPPPDNGNNPPPNNGGGGMMASSTGRGGFRGNMPNVPAGDKMFFGTIQSASGSSLTVSGFARGGNGSGSPTATTVTLSSGTTFGPSTTASNLTTGVRVFGYGTPNSDGSITAVQIQVAPMRQGGGNGHYNGGMNGGGQTPPQQ